MVILQMYSYNQKIILDEVADTNVKSAFPILAIKVWIRIGILMLD